MTELCDRLGEFKAPSKESDKTYGSVKNILKSTIKNGFFEGMSQNEIETLFLKI